MRRTLRILVLLFLTGALLPALPGCSSGRRSGWNGFGYRQDYGHGHGYGKIAHRGHRHHMPYSRYGSYGHFSQHQDSYGHHHRPRHLDRGGFHGGNHLGEAFD